ncbi:MULTISPECIES: GNAT family N-acetyltransferase [unclassified Beijerinckia]|uniref:GNAT family N-acetyltransferase n=1 Tax=unclassified Beijerinckia TaxID=2638183 RepID=UPI00089C1361|nr:MULTISPECIES: GNAT family N-acetyltransferase [unclassified Beijerinckia]MDH7796554.1 hypothetical protein [Beijerinckia sp. GAS462]SEC50016.1 Acetyltransferase (GNAT) family protein [Beijerinckia sp. 28-YEA-48]
MSAYEFALAGQADIEAIATLLQANEPSRGGSLTGEFPREKVEHMVLQGPTIVARHEGHVVGVLFSAAKDLNRDIAVIRAMFAAWPGAPDAYQYGPVCIAASERGKGLMPLLYQALQKLHPGREAVLFIRADNAASIRAHERLGMRKMTSFLLDDVEYGVFSDRPAAPPS